MIIKNYRNNTALRQSFNELAIKTFDINFEDWYRNGYWTDNYNPYSIVMDGKVVSNVSVNHMNFLWHGKRKFFIQLGTVMTDEAYRNRGLLRQIMKEIEQDYGTKADGFFLFANDSVLDFYPKFGFEQSTEYQCTREITSEISTIKEPAIEQVPMRDKDAWTLLQNAIQTSIPCGSFEMADNSELILFYITKYMQENVFYHREQEAYVIAEVNNGDLLIHNIFAPRPVEIARIVSAFGNGIRQVRLGFTPENSTGYTISLLKEEDCTLFLKGRGFDGFEAERLMFPLLAHA